MQTKTKKLGKSVIVIVWVIASCVSLILGALFFLTLEGKYFTTEAEEVVSVVRLAGFSQEMGDDKHQSFIYVIRFPSGGEQHLNLLGAPDLQAGTKLKLLYGRTKFTKSVLIRKFEVLSDNQ